MLLFNDISFRCCLHLSPILQWEQFKGVFSCSSFQIVFSALYWVNFSHGHNLWLCIYHLDDDLWQIWDLPISILGCCRHALSLQLQGHAIYFGCKRDLGPLRQLLYSVGSSGTSSTVFFLATQVKDESKSWTQPPPLGLWLSAKLFLSMSLVYLYKNARFMFRNKEL